MHAVQTLSRLNRTYRAPSGEVKDTTYRARLRQRTRGDPRGVPDLLPRGHVETATDPNLVHRLATKLAQARIYTANDVEEYARHGGPRTSPTQPGGGGDSGPRRVRRPLGGRRRAAGQPDARRAADFRKDCGSTCACTTSCPRSSTTGQRSGEAGRVPAPADASLPSDGAGLRTSTCPGSNSAGYGRSTRARPISGQWQSDHARANGNHRDRLHVSRQDPQQELLSEVVARINSLFGSEFADPQIEGFVIAAAGMASENLRIASRSTITRSTSSSHHPTSARR